MDINFHYFTVKTIALEAGFDELSAQRIASYSQFVDDYNIWSNYIFEKVPDYAKSLVNSSSIFYTVTTGFHNAADMSRLIIEKYQREVVVPFHFIPTKKLKDFPSNTLCSEYRTSQATISSTFLISKLLENAKQKYINSEAPNGIKAEEYNLIRIGILLHIFADTYAHQNFSGFLGWENLSYLIKVTDNFKDKDITENYKPDIYHELPAIGHGNINTAPDNTFASWIMIMAAKENQKRKDEYRLKYLRSNTQVFCDAAREICNFLLSCQDKPIINESNWESIKVKLLKGFNTHEKKENSLVSHWKAITGYNYHYNKDEQWANLLVAGNKFLSSGERSSLLKTEYVSSGTIKPITMVDMGMFEKSYKSAKDDFFYYNLIAKEIRDAVIG